MRALVHGKSGRYLAGCRCDVCVSALPHRTVGGYTKWRCRCSDCRLAMASYRQFLRRSYAQAPPADVPHGRGGYTNYGCRCGICRKANSQVSRDWRARRGAASGDAS